MIRQKGKFFRILLTISETDKIKGTIRVLNCVTHISKYSALVPLYTTYLPTPYVKSRQVINKKSPSNEESTINVSKFLLKCFWFSVKVFTSLFFSDVKFVTKTYSKSNFCKWKIYRKSPIVLDCHYSILPWSNTNFSNKGLVLKSSDTTVMHRFLLILFENQIDYKL